MSKIHPLYEYKDVKYFYNLHLERMKQIGEQPVSYKSFRTRLKRRSTLKNAIYTPSHTSMVRKYAKAKKKHSLWLRFTSLFK